MRIIKLDMRELLKNDNGDYKMVYDTLISTNGVDYWVQTMEAYYSKYFDIIKECERPQGIRVNQMQKALLTYLIDNKYINKEYMGGRK